MKSEVTYQKNESSPRRPAGNDFIKWQFPFFCAPFFTFALIWLPTTVRRGIGYLLTRQTLRVAKWIEPPSWTLFYVVLSLALSLSPCASVCVCGWVGACVGACVCVCV